MNPTGKKYNALKNGNEWIHPKCIYIYTKTPITFFSQLVEHWKKTQICFAFFTVTL